MKKFKEGKKLLNSEISENDIDEVLYKYDVYLYTICRIDNEIYVLCDNYAQSNMQHFVDVTDEYISQFIDRKEYLNVITHLTIIYEEYLKYITNIVEV